VYFNLVNVGQSWVSTGRIELLPFMLALHGGIFTIAISWVYARHMNWSWRSWFTFPRPTKGAA
jgi:lipopolysaccharide export system permease protein